MPEEYANETKPTHTTSKKLMNNAKTYNNIGIQQFFQSNMTFDHDFSTITWHNELFKLKANKDIINGNEKQSDCSKP